MINIISITYIFHTYNAYLLDKILSTYLILRHYFDTMVPNTTDINKLI